ncbi:hypothetical protein [Kitasatospora sp. NPDC093806]|uniref:hypothetical protein n=1 Tax=Kitasatospora sp. NPDC093806 TaxID=3155075 RepID=UPI003429719E
MMSNQLFPPCKCPNNCGGRPEALHRFTDAPLPAGAHIRHADIPTMRPPYRPRRGELVRDERTSCVGVYMDVQDGEVYLRPEAGGREWTAAPEHITPVGGRGSLSERLAVRNRDSRSNPDETR